MCRVECELCVHCGLCPIYRLTSSVRVLRTQTNIHWKILSSHHKSLGLNFSVKSTHSHTDTHTNTYSVHKRMHTHEPNERRRIRRFWVVFFSLFYISPSIALSLALIIIWLIMKTRSTVYVVGPKMFTPIILSKGFESNKSIKSFALVVELFQVVVVVFGFVVSVFWIVWNYIFGWSRALKTHSHDHDIHFSFA